MALQKNQPSARLLPVFHQQKGQIATDLPFVLVR